MKQTRFFKRNYKRAIAVGLAAAFAQGSLMAQFKVHSDKIEIEELRSPDFGGTVGESNKSFTPKEWLEIAMKIKLEVPASKKDKTQFADKVKVEWNVAFKSPEGGKRLLNLEKEVEYVNVPINEDVYVSVYLSPSAIKRLTGSERPNKNDIEEVGGEVTINGSSAHDNTGFFSMNTKGKWWTKGTVSDSDEVKLRNKDETPFKFLWYDIYAEIEAED